MCRYFAEILLLVLACGYSTSREYEEFDGQEGNRTDRPLTGSELLGMRIVKDSPVVVVVELSEPLLGHLKKIVQEMDDVNLQINKTLLVTFNSAGLQSKSSYFHTTNLFNTITSLSSSAGGSEKSTPTMRVLNELVQGTLGGSVLLVTMSAPSDVDFTDALAKTLMERKSRLSVLWGGNHKRSDFDQLKNLTEQTHGTFDFFQYDEAEVQSFNTTKILTSSLMNRGALTENITNNFGKLRFPEASKELEAEGEENLLTSRIATSTNLRKVVVPVIVEVASGANLEMRPGSSAQIPFTVKNNLNVPLRMTFRATFNGVLQNVQPPRADLQASNAATVTVNINSFSAAPSNALGTLKFIVEAANVVMSRSALISYSSQSFTDNTPPKLTYKYEGDCSNYRDPQNCENGSWGFEATIHDEDSGLLKILSEPYGLFFQSEFIAGTKSPMTVFYTASCCQSKVDLWAEDLRGNHVKKSFDVFNQNLYAGEIAAIVLGVLCLLCVIIGVVVGVILYKRRNRRNMIIPRARAGSR